MVKNQQLFSLQVERHVISALLKHPTIFPDIDGFVTEYDFYNQTHQTIFSVIRSILLSGEALDKVLVGQKIKNLGIRLNDDIDIFSYLDSLASSQITPKAGVKAFQELVALRIRREICGTADKLKTFIYENGDLPVDELIAQTDKIYNDKISTYNVQEEPQDLFAGVEDLIRSSGLNPKEETGLITPYKQFNGLFGGVRAGNGLYAIVSRPKEGKSSWLLQMAKEMTLLNPNTVALYLDTEMQTEVSQYRAGAAVTEVPMWYLETGNWSRNKELTTRINKNISKVNPYKGKVFHLNVANRPIEQICSLIRRWYYKHVGRNTGKKAVIVYDYIKLTGEKIGQNWAEYQAIGEKINRLNETGGDLNVPIWSAMQLNRSAEDGRDDSAAISLSDRLQWFAAFVGIFRRKRLEELSLYGTEFGSHLLIPLATRFQGRDAAGHHDLVQVSIGKKDKKPKYERNFINYHIENFGIEERGTLVDIVKALQEKYDIETGEQGDDSGDLL